uniref:Putative secreted protein n=1 Tax=Anopheles marajoara TaxID=58244 RepID=A0A2M4CE16_9DIPT
MATRYLIHCFVFYFLRTRMARGIGCGVNRLFGRRSTRRRKNPRDRRPLLKWHTGWMSQGGNTNHINAPGRI